MSKSLADRWDNIRNKIELTDITLDGIGKFLLGMGLGGFLAPWKSSYCVVLVAAGFILTIGVKAKYWKSFWSD
jgi:hypothetical protein